MLTCKQTFLLKLESHYRRLSWQERAGVRLHLMFCNACGRVRRQVDFLRKAARRFSDEPADADEQARLSAEALERIARNLDRYE